VFADVTVSGPEEVKRNWDAIKAAERAEAAGAPVSVLDTVPFGQPALSLAAQLQRRAERAGVPAGLAGLPPGDPAHRGEGDGGAGDAPAGGNGAAGGPAVSDIGAELFALVARAREAGLDPELELRAAARAYRDRVRAWERSERG
jgi:XTP/dITP diphosphohydrolase